MDDLFFFLIDRHLEPMLEIAASLGDDLVNRRPDLPGANSPYQIVWHSCGMLEWWSREAVLGQAVGRDRAAEFEASGTVEQLQRRAGQVTRQFREDLARTDLDAPLRTQHAGYSGLPISASARGALLHAFEELAQHHGHLEISRDVILGTR